MYDKENAYKFLDNVKNMTFFYALGEIQKNPNYKHSDRWSMIYDLLEENNYSTKGTIVTDLTYLIEEEAELLNK